MAFGYSSTQQSTKQTTTSWGNPLNCMELQANFLKKLEKKVSYVVNLQYRSNVRELGEATM